jgi:sodium-dependent phosphate cotransporter
MNAYLAILIGCGITIAVQSSSITTSMLVPLVAVEAIRLEKMFPLTLGANIGTTATAILAALNSDKKDAIQIALVHLFFNIIGVLIWYPIPFMRKIPLNLAKKLGNLVGSNRSWAVAYTVTVFFIIPGILLGLSEAGKAVLYGVLFPILFIGIVFFVLKKYRPDLLDKIKCFRSPQVIPMRSV